ncbi:MAG TPA: transketolase [Candidatus Eisenbacteria bacterium]|jgi:transketolase|nr:transketolase [Candidatus Eisenbacteria bacterium]
MTDNDRASVAVTTSTADLERLCRLVRTYIVRETTAAGSGHVTSSFSATELMTALFFHRLHFDLARPELANNDRVVFSKGHASPLLYALYAAAGAVPEAQLDTLRKLGSPLEGHPTPNFRYADAATGSLGQGISIALGMALAARKLDQLTCMTWTLLGDGELAEGSVWEAAELASHYELSNLVAICDINRLGQSGPTMVQHHTEIYRARFEAFGWKTHVIDGHDLDALCALYDSIDGRGNQPVAIVASTIKGKGFSLVADKEGWHGKALTPEQAQQCYKEIGPADPDPPGAIAKPEPKQPVRKRPELPAPITYKLGDKVATRKAYGDALARLGKAMPEVVALDGDVKNSTFAEDFAKAVPDRYFDMFIAEQNMVGTAVGLSTRGHVPFVSTFAAFMSRAYDQVRMAVYSRANVKFVGSHCGVSIGEDGPSQMGLEDLAMFRALGQSVVLYPSDAVSTERCVELLITHRGIGYLRTTRPATPVLYCEADVFHLGGSMVPRHSEADRLTIVGAGITVHEALKAADALAGKGLAVRVVDAYSIKPLDREGLLAHARATGGQLLVVEDHWPEGGLGEAVAGALSYEPDVRVWRMAVQGIPSSASPEDTMRCARIDAAAIQTQAEKLIGGKG